MHRQDAAEFISQEIAQPATDSKKWNAFLIGVIGVALIFVSSLVVFIVKPEVAANIASVTTVTLGAYAGLISVYVGAQALVDNQNTSSLTQLAQ